MNPKLGDLANKDIEGDSNGLLFGESFIKILGKYVSTFSAFSRAQSNMRRMFGGRQIFGRADRARPSASRGYSRSFYQQQQRGYGRYLQGHNSFFPQRGRNYCNRGGGNNCSKAKEIKVTTPPFGSFAPKVGGRLSVFSKNWLSIPNDIWVLETVKGFKIDFVSTPHQTSPPRELVLDQDQSALVDEEVRQMLDKGAILIVSNPGPGGGFVSTIFLVKKKEKGWRPVINLRLLNFFLVYRHFKMEGIHLLRDILQEKDWLIKLDLKDAYFTIPMDPELQKNLRFIWRGVTYQFRCLPFGISSAPWCFTKILRPVVASLRRRGVRLIIYLDDILLMSQSQEELLLHMRWTVELLERLGFIISVEKSVMTPSQSLEFLGFQVNTSSAKLKKIGQNKEGSLLRFVKRFGD